MALPEIQQINELLKNRQKILITFKEQYTADALASGLALSLYLRAHGKDITVAAHGFKLHDHHKFLPETDTVKPNLNALKKVVISLDIAKKPVRDFSYNVEGGKLNIVLTPEREPLTPEDITTHHEDYPFDLVFVLDTDDFEALGELYNNNTEFFYHVPVVNIDHHATNERMGQINVIDVTASSTCEIVYRLLRELDQQAITPDVATCLLSGVVAKTNCFKDNKITPKCLAMASELIHAGARREEIIKNLYQYKTVNTLKLWGRVLARLKETRQQTILWSLVKTDDFIQSQTAAEDLDGVIDELVANIPTAELVIIIYEQGADSHMMVRSLSPQWEATALFHLFNPIGNKSAVHIRLQNTSLIMAEQKLLDIIKPS